jgi:hypothetical protein
MLGCFVDLRNVGSWKLLWVKTSCKKFCMTEELGAGWWGKDLEGI